MNITTKLIPEEDEFGNTVYCHKRFYYFDDNLFNIIKEYLFYRKKRQKAVLTIYVDDKFRIRNQLQYGLFIKNSRKIYTQKELIPIIPSIFNIEFSNHHLFVDIVRVYNDVMICDVFKPEKEKVNPVMLGEFIKIQVNAEPIILIQECDINIYKRTEVKLGTIYVSTLRERDFYMGPRNDPNCFREIIPKGTFTQEQIREKYGLEILNNVLHNKNIEFII